MTDNKTNNNTANTSSSVSGNYTIENVIVTESVHDLVSLLSESTNSDQHHNATISTGIGFLDHMIDQFNSHAQIGVALRVGAKTATTTTDLQEDTTTTKSHGSSKLEYINRFAMTTNTSNHGDHNSDTKDQQNEITSLVGHAIGMELKKLVQQAQETRRLHGEELISQSRFVCPLDEALTECIIDVINDDTTTNNDNTTTGTLKKYTVGMGGKYSRSYIGYTYLPAFELFWSALAKSSSILNVSLTKIRGTNSHHIIESSFKAFARCFRNLLDDINTSNTTLSIQTIFTDVSKNFDNYNLVESSRSIESLYGPGSNNWNASVQLQRIGSISRTTKETSINVLLRFDGSGADKVGDDRYGTNIISTGIDMLDRFYRSLFHAATVSYQIQCMGDTYIDEHHTAEDVSIAIGQCINSALGTKGGLNRMWTCTTNIAVDTADSNAIASVEVTMDLSNRPELVHNIDFNLYDTKSSSSSSELYWNHEKIHDLSYEMLEHVLESLVINSKMTVHIVVSITDAKTATDRLPNPDEIITAIAMSFGQCFRYCSMMDIRRAGMTASSKGTLSV